MNSCLTVAISRKTQRRLFQKLQKRQRGSNAQTVERFVGCIALLCGVATIAFLSTTAWTTRWQRTRFHFKHITSNVRFVGSFFHGCSFIMLINLSNEHLLLFWCQIKKASEYQFDSVIHDSLGLKFPQTGQLVGCIEFGTFSQETQGR